MSEIVALSSQLELPFEPPPPLDAAELSATTFLARYSGRTLESYRADLRRLLPMGCRCGASPGRRQFGRDVNALDRQSGGCA